MALRYTIPTMQERNRQPGTGPSYIRGPTRGDFTDWDNPEDEWQEAPESYNEEEEEEEEEWEELDQDDPDYDLSEAAGLAAYPELVEDDPAKAAGGLPASSSSTSTYGLP